MENSMYNLTRVLIWCSEGNNEAYMSPNQLISATSDEPNMNEAKDVYACTCSSSLSNLFDTVCLIFCSQS